MTERSVRISTAAMVGRAWRHWRPHRRLLWLLLPSLLVQQLFMTGLALSLKIVIDGLLSREQTLPLGWLVALLGIGYALAAGASLSTEYVGSVATAEITNDIRRHLFSHLQRLGMDFYGRIGLGDILSRFSNDLSVVRQGLTERVVEGMSAIVALLLNLPVLFWLEWRLALLTTLSLPLAMYIVNRLTPGVADATYIMKRAEGTVLDTVQENVRAQPVVQAFGLHRLAIDRFHKEVMELGRISVRSGFLISLVGTLATLGAQCVQLLITATGAFMALEGHLQAGALAAFLHVLNLVSKSAYDITKRVVPSLIHASGGLQRIEELLDAPVRVADARTAVDLPPVRGAVTFDRVAFAYTPEDPILRDFHLSISPGESVALVGASGSGKSTVLKLLMRFHDPTGGTVQVDEIDLRACTLSSLRDQIGVVFQDSFLFDTELQENIRLAKSGATDDEVLEAVKIAELEPVIQRLPQGLGTRVGEAGGRLSGGQRQRVAIARAMIRQPSILVLDEATSALDPGTEAAITGTLARVRRGRTVVSVTHRLSSVIDYDRIVVLEGGVVAEEGPHDALLARGGVYARLWAKQHGFQVSTDGRFARVDAARLQGIPLFAALDERRRLFLAEQFRSESFAAGEVIFEQGSPGDRFYVLVRGQVEVRVDTRRLAVLEDGDFFGELALLDDLPRSATVSARGPCLTITLGRDAFRALLEDAPDLEAEVRRVAQFRRES